MMTKTPLTEKESAAHNEPVPEKAKMVDKGNGEAFTGSSAPGIHFSSLLRDIMLLSSIWNVCYIYLHKLLILKKMFTEAMSLFYFILFFASK